MARFKFFQSLIVHHIRTPLFANAYFFILNAFATSGLGFLFWKLIAYVYTPEAIGLASAFLNTCNLISSFANLGLPYGTIYFLNKIPSGQKRSLFVSNLYTISGTMALLLSFLFVLLIGILIPRLNFIQNSLLGMLFFFGFSVASTWNTISDQTFAGFREAKFVLFRNLIANTLRIPLVYLFKSYFILGIIFGTTFSVWIALIWAITTIKKLEDAFKLKFILRTEYTKNLLKYGFPNFTSSWTWRLPEFLLPIIILNNFGSETNAIFFLSWMIASMVFVIGSSVSNSLFIENSQSDNFDVPNLFRSIFFSFTLQSFALVGILLGGSHILFWFGDFYVSEGIVFLRVLACASYGYTVNSIVFTIMRTHKLMRALNIISTIPLLIIVYINLLQQPSSPINTIWSWFSGIYCSAIIGGIYLILFFRKELKHEKNSRKTA